MTDTNVVEPVDSRAGAEPIAHQATRTRTRSPRGRGSGDRPGVARLADGRRHPRGARGQGQRPAAVSRPAKKQGPSARADRAEGAGTVAVAALARPGCRGRRRRWGSAPRAVSAAWVWARDGVQRGGRRAAARGRGPVEVAAPDGSGARRPGRGGDQLDPPGPVGGLSRPDRHDPRRPRRPCALLDRAARLAALEPDREVRPGTAAARRVAHAGGRALARSLGQTPRRVRPGLGGTGLLAAGKTESAPCGRSGRRWSWPPRADLDAVGRCRPSSTTRRSGATRYRPRTPSARSSARWPGRPRWSYKDWSGALPRGTAAAVSPRGSSASRKPRRRGGARRRAGRAGSRGRPSRARGRSSTDRAAEAVRLAAGAEALAMKQRWADARDRYRQAIELMPVDVVRRAWWLNLADLAARLDEDSERQKALEAAKVADLKDEITRRAVELQSRSGAFARRPGGPRGPRSRDGGQTLRTPGGGDDGRTPRIEPGRQRPRAAEGRPTPARERDAHDTDSRRTTLHPAARVKSRPPLFALHRPTPGPTPARARSLAGAAVAVGLPRPDLLDEHRPLRARLVDRRELQPRLPRPADQPLLRQPGRRTRARSRSGAGRGWASALLVVALAGEAGDGRRRRSGSLGDLALLVGAGRDSAPCWRGRTALRRYGFAFAFLVFMVPLPVAPLRDDRLAAATAGQPGRLGRS